MRAPAAASTRRSASRSTCWAWVRSLDTTHTVSSARCHRSLCAVSAAETLKRLWSLSLRLFRTWRLSLSERHPSRCSSQVITPTTTAQPPRAAFPTSRRRHEGARDFLDPIGLDQVAHLDVVEVLDPDPALEPLADLAHVVLEALERGDGALVHLDPVADDAHARGPRDHARAHEAPGDRAHFRDLEDLPHLRLAQHDLLLLGREQALHGRLHFLHRLVDDAVGADLDFLPLRRRARVRVGAPVEADDDRARRLGEEHVGLGDRADSAMHDLHLDLARGQLRQRVGERLGRAALVRLDDEPQRRSATLDALRHEVLEGLHAAGAAMLRLPLQPLAL